MTRDLWVMLIACAIVIVMFITAALVAAAGY
jgi:hypothetical protein